jgi:hypothetical protein
MTNEQFKGIIACALATTAGFMAMGHASNQQAVAACLASKDLCAQLQPAEEPGEEPAEVATAQKMTTPQRAVCLRQLKDSLKDPDSLRRLGSPSQENASGIIKYTATNSFGGRVTGYYVCATGFNVTA